MSSVRYVEPEVDSEKAILRPPDSEVAALAYQLWEDRGCPIGSPEEDWLLAETELVNQRRRSARIL